MRLMFQAMVTRFHSPWAFSSPRMLIWRQPITRLMMPNTSSTVCLAQLVQRSPGLGAQLVGHAHQRIARLGRWRIRSEALHHW